MYNRSLEEMSEKRRRFIQIIEILMRQKFIIMATFVVVVGIVTIYTFNLPRTYQATTSIMIKNDAISKSLGILDLSGSAFRNLQNELEILKSRDLQEKIAYKIIDQKYLTNRNKKDTLMIYKRALKMSGKGKSLLLENILISLYENSRFDLPKNNDIIKISVVSQSPAEAAYIANTIAETYYERDLLRSRSSAKEVRMFLEKQSDTRKTELVKSEESLQNHMERYGVTSLGSNSELIIQKITDFESQLENNKIELENTKLLLTEYQDELEKAIPNMSKSIVEGNELYVKELQGIIADYESKRDVAKVLSGKNSNRPEYIAEMNRQNKTIDSLKQVLARRTDEYINTSLENYSLSSDNSQQNLISQLTSQIQQLKIKKETLSLSNNMLNEILGKYERQYQRLPKQNTRIARLMREKEFNEKLYLKIGEQYQEALLSELSIFGRVEVLDKAVIPSIPIAPKKKLNVIIGAFLGIILGVFVAFLLNYFFHLIRTPEDIELSGFKLISIIPRLKFNQEQQKYLLTSGNHSFLPPKTVYKEIQYSVVTESYQRLQMFLSYSLKNKKISSLVVTSAGPGEGKSVTAANLAITLANSGKKVLVVDTDMRRPTMHHFFDMKVSYSLAHYLYNKATLEDIIKHTHIKNLDVVMSMELSNNASMVLNTPEMHRFMQIVNAEYDCVIYDTPPVNAVADAIHLAKNVDEVLVVARADTTKYDELMRANKLLKQYNVSIAGVVLNDCDGNKLSGYYGEYYGMYSADKGNSKIRKLTKNRIKNMSIRKRNLLHSTEPVKFEEVEE